MHYLCFFVRLAGLRDLPHLEDQRVRQAERGPQAEFTVTGRGVGIDSDLQSHLLGNGRLRSLLTVEELVRHAHKLLAALFDYSDRIWAKEDHPLLGRPFNLVTAIQGGGYIAVPETCKISLIRKILPSEKVPAVQAELEEILRSLAIREGIQTEIEYTAPRDEQYGGQPAEIPTDLEPVRRLADAIHEVTGKTNLIQGSPYWSETSVFVNELGIPAVYCGAGDITVCHTLNERVRAAELIDSVRAFALMMVDYCGVAEG